jgi:glycine cleavage system H protein
MSRKVLASGAQPCVWMCAGVLRYRLCTHEYDCDNCPLDAALRGDAQIPSAHPPTSPYAPAFPDDRRYAVGHTWLRETPGGNEGAWRLGLDAFAAAMVADTRAVSWESTRWVVEPGDTLCTLDVGLGALSVRAPVRARVLRENGALRLYPGRVVTAPYEGGWLLEVAPLDAQEMAGLLTAAAAREAAVRDLRSFRRSVALSVLREQDGDRRPETQDVALHDLRWLLCGCHYVEFLGELVH